METVTLNNGVSMPMLGFGVFGMADGTSCERAVRDAFECGYRLVDTAAAYGNERSVGNAIKNSGIKREALFITTKLWIQDAGYEKTKRAFQKSLDRLQLDYLDLYLIHEPYGDTFGSWRAMQELYHEGLVRAIGVADFHTDKTMDLIVNDGFTPAVNQLETHPFNQQMETHQFLKENNVQLQSWAPFAQGKNDLFTNEVLIAIGNQYGKSVAQVILRWLIQRGIPAVTRTVSAERMKENRNVFDFSLTEEDLLAIETIDLNDSLFLNHRDPETVKRLSRQKFDL